MLKTLRGFFIYGAGEFLARLISFFGFLVLARALSKAEYGLVESYVVTLGLIGIVSSAGLNNALQAFYYSKKEYPDVSESRRISTAFYALLIWQIGLVVAGAFVTVAIDTALSFKIALMLACIAVLTVQLQLMQDVFRLRFEPIKYLVSTLLTKGGAAVASVSMVLMGFGIEGYLWGHALALLGSFLLMFWLLREVLAESPHSSLTKSMLRYGLPFVLVGIGGWTFTSLDRWLLASSSGLSAVGEYAFAVRISFLVSFLSLAFGQAWAPMVFKLKESRPIDYLAIYSDTFLSFTLVISVLAAFISVFASEFQSAVFGDKYKEAQLAILFLCFSAVAQSTTNFTAVGISLSRKTQYFAFFTWLAAGLSLLANSLLIPRWGINAAALVNLGSTCLLSLLYFRVSQREHRMRFSFGDISFVFLFVTYLFLGSVVFVLIGRPLELMIYKVIFLALAFIGLGYYLRLMVGKYVQ